MAGSSMPGRSRAARPPKTSRLTNAIRAPDHAHYQSLLSVHSSRRYPPRAHTAPGGSMIAIQTSKQSVWQGKSYWALRALALAALLAMAIGARAEERVVKSKVSPVYPEVAKRMRISGVVKVEANVDADGKVTEAKALSGNMMLAPAAEDAVRKWRFAPAASGSKVDVDVNFNLAQ